MDASADGSPDSWYRVVVDEHSRRHKLDMPTSCSVVLNLMTLEQARSVRHARPRQLVASATPREKQPVNLLAPVVIILLLLAAVIGFKNPREASAQADLRPEPAATKVSPQEEAAPSTPVAVQPELVSFRTDPLGNLTAVEGPDPLTILNAFCTHPQSGLRYNPVMLAQAMPPDSGVRLGIVSDQQNVGARMAVNIYRYSATGRWMMGDGMSAITFRPAPTLPLSLETEPI